MSDKDTIYRQAAIDTVAKHFRIDNDLLEVIVYEMERLPSAQPEHIHCKDCRWFESDRHQCGRQICAVFYEDDYCSFAERRTD